MADLPLPIVGEKVVIRNSTEGDLHLLYALETDENVKYYLGGPSKHGCDEWIAGMGKCLDKLFVVTVRSTGDFAGSASLKPPDFLTNEPELRVLIKRRYWGQRFGDEVSRLLIGTAFDHFGSSAITAVVHPDNAASRVLCERLGFCRVGKKSYGRGLTRWDSGHDIFRLPKP
jgi:RimJ/RimL family protein N-acetyltransferase